MQRVPDLLAFQQRWGSSVGPRHRGKVVPGSASKADLSPQSLSTCLRSGTIFGAECSWGLLLLPLLLCCSPEKTVHMKRWLPAELAALLAATESKYHCAFVAISAHHEDVLNLSLSQV